MTEMKEVIVKPVSREVRDAVLAESTHRGVSMNDVAVSILAEKFSVPFEQRPPREQPPRAASAGNLGDTPGFVLRMPRRLKRKLDVEAGRREVYRYELVSEVLAEALGVERAAA